MKKIYYAHSLHIYNTNQERRDIEHLRQLGFEVVNPNTDEHKYQVDIIKFNNRDKEDSGALVMDYFERVVSFCDGLAFRGLHDGSIPAGVAKEVWIARTIGMPIIELPHLLDKRVLSVTDTRYILGYNGQR